MKRIFILTVLITFLEVWAFVVFRSHPLTRPEWFPTLLLSIQLLMGLGGIYSARWLLRDSPIAKLEAPFSDWTKLWLWCGPLGGLLLVVACLLGQLATENTNTILAGLVVTAHIAGGAVLWTVALPWAVADLYNDEAAGFRERLLMQLGIASHVIGFSVYFGFFPGREVPPLSVLGAVYFFGFNLYYIMLVSIGWNTIFRWWKPEDRFEDGEDEDPNEDQPLLR